MKNSIYFCSHFQCFFSFAWRSSCCRLVFYLFSMSFLLFISVLNNSPESSKRRDLYIFCFQQQSQQFLLWECVYIYSNEMYATIIWAHTFIRIKSRYFLWCAYFLFTPTLNIFVSLLKYVVRICFELWRYTFFVDLKHKGFLWFHIIIFFILNFFSVVILHENRTAHALNIKHGQTNAQTICEYHARKSSIEHHLHMIPKCHNLNRFIYKIQFVCETDQKPGAHITLFGMREKTAHNAESGRVFYVSFLPNVFEHIDLFTLTMHNLCTNRNIRQRLSA